MEKEISSGTMLGIVLIALAAVIGLGFGVFSIAKGVANEGTVGVQDNLNAVSDSAFEDYNDKIVTGTMVKSAVQNFAGKSVAILINTNAMDKGVKSYKEHKSLSVWQLAASTTGAMTPVSTVTGTGENQVVNYGSKGGDAVGTAIKDDTVGKGYFVNYNAILNTADKDKAMNIKDGVYVTDYAFAIDSTGKVLYDNSVGGFSRTGNCEYISPSAKFTANLIKDTSGTSIGIVFEQQIK